MSRLFPKPTVFISGQELSSVLGKVSLFDVRANLMDSSYGKTQHIKQRPAGSLFVDLEGPIIDHTGKNENGGGRHPLPPKTEFISFCEKSGIGRKPAVLFDDMSNMFSGRLFWMLDNIGIEAYLLNGGIHSYLADVPDAPLESGSDNLISTVVEPFPAGSSPYAQENKTGDKWENTISLEELDKIIEDKSRVIVDARAPDRYGSSLRPGAGPDSLSSHIPTAINVPFGSNLNGQMPGAASARLRSTSELEQKFKNLLQTYKVKDPSRDMVLSCGSGVSTMVNFAIMKHLDLGKAPIYIGSWSEYQNKRKDKITRDQIECQGFSIYFDKINNAQDPPVKVVDSGLAVTVDGVNYENGKAAIDALGKDDENFEKALSQLRSTEVVTISTAKKTYKVEQK